MGKKIEINLATRNPKNTKFAKKMKKKIKYAAPTLFVSFHHGRPRTQVQYIESSGAKRVMQN
jgi:hypothetical protein